MPERRRCGRVLLYGASGVVALARRGAPRPSGPRPASAALVERRLRRRGGTAQRVRAARARPPARRATAPWDIPWRGWKDILGRTFAKINDDRLLSVAAGAVFYELLALFPAIAVFVALYGLFANASTIDAQVSTLSGVLPGGALDLLHEELRRLAARPRAQTASGFVVGLLVALWSATSGVKADHRRAQRRL